MKLNNRVRLKKHSKTLSTFAKLKNSKTNNDNWFKYQEKSTVYRTMSETLKHNGYLSVLPYQTTTESLLCYYLEKHQCPCCLKEQEYDLDSSQTLIHSEKGRNLISMATECECGFMVPFHAVVNNLNSTLSSALKLKQQNETDSADYLALDIEALELECRYLLHIGGYKTALSRLSQYEKSFPYLALIPFYRAFAFEKLGLYELALQRYDLCLDLTPECTEAWHNKSIILKRLHREEEANFNIMKYCQLNLAGGCNNSQHLYESAQVGKTLKCVKGKFGDIQIVQTPNIRYLSINREIEGSFWLKHGQPSNVPAGDYVAGFLLAGYYFKADSHCTTGLMLGLGAGAGVVALLENFNKLNLTVVEIDQEIITIACQYFPLLQRYIAEGRLTIICQDVFNYFDKFSNEKFSDKTSRKVDFVLLDIYQGNCEFSSRLRQSEFLSAIKSIASLIGINLLPQQSQQEYDQIIHDFNQAGIELKISYQTGLRGNSEIPYRNRILFSDKIKDAPDFMPFARSNADYLVRAYQRDYVHMISRCELIDP